MSPNSTQPPPLKEHPSTALFIALSMDAFVVFASGCAWEEGGRALTLQEVRAVQARRFECVELKCRDV